MLDSAFRLPIPFEITVGIAISICVIFMVFDEMSAGCLVLIFVSDSKVLTYTVFDSQSNASSGMGVAEHCKGTFLELQRKKAHRYVIFKIDEKKNQVVVEKTGSPAESYEDFTSALPENDCRYAVYDFDFVTSDNCQKSKIFFIAWLAFLVTCRLRIIFYCLYPLIYIV